VQPASIHLPMTRSAPARIGDSVSDIDSPALVIDLDAFERNLSRMADHARSKNMRLRPHAKTHKCAAIALRQIELGAVGVCVQKVDEAIALAARGVRDILVTNEVIAPAKLERLARLARQISLGVAVDSEVGIDRLAAALHACGASVDVFLEVDVGHGRCGVDPSLAAPLAQRIVSHGALRFAGLQAYHGSAQHFRTGVERGTAIARATAAAASAKAAIEATGIDVPLVTGAGTGTFPLESASGLWGELQPGSYVFLDRDYAQNTPDPQAPGFEHALFLKSQVISRNAHQAVIDAGHKSHALDSGPPAVWGRALAWSNGGDEHGIVRALPGETLPDIGETVWLVPGHCDPTVNLHDHLVGVRGGLEGGRVETVWPVDARGAFG
jgi:D-serine deaminase-like pyridoxal phosphate-dependent protein